MGPIAWQHHSGCYGGDVTLKALLFDMDGTLVDSDPIHIAVFIDFLAERGVTLTEAEYMARIHGRTNLEIFSDLLPDEDPREMDLAKEAEYRRRVGDRMEPMPGLRDLIDAARKAELGLAVVTNGPRANLDAVLNATGLSDAFACGVTSNDVTNGKPDPVPYQRALDELGVAAGEALVFEDSPSGIRSGRAAGIEVIGLATSLDADTLKRHGARFAIKDFTDPALTRHLNALEGAFV